MSWICSLCGEEESEEWDSKFDAIDHVKDNHIQALAEMSVERITEDKLGHEPIDEV